MAFVVITTTYGLADVAFKYDADVVAIVKAIPSRKYFADGKYWEILATHVPTLANWLTTAGHDVRVNGVRWEHTDRPKGKSSGDSNPFAAFFDSIPSEYRTKAYKALTRVFHPDTGGEHVLMQKLNEAKP